MGPSESHTPLYPLWPAKYFERPERGTCVIDRLPSSLLFYVFELVHGEDAIPISRYQAQTRLTIKSIINVSKRWHRLGLRVMLTRIHLEVGSEAEAPHFRRWLTGRLEKNESLRSSTREIFIIFRDRPTTYENQNRRADEPWVAETLQLLRWWHRSLQKVELDGPVFMRSAKRVLWQLTKMPLKELCFQEISLAFFLKYFHFPGIKRLSWSRMSWSDDPERLVALFSGEASEFSVSVAIAKDREKSLDLEELSISNPYIPVDKLELLLRACKSLRRFDFGYWLTMDKRYTVPNLQRLLDVQAHSMRETNLGHIFESSQGGIEREMMIDFTSMSQLNWLSLNADNVYCLDPAYFAMMVCAPRLQYLTINFESEAEYGVYSSRLNQLLYEWLVDFAVTWSSFTQSMHEKLRFHLDGGLDWSIDDRTFDPTEGYVRPWPWDYLEAAKRAVATHGIELTWTQPLEYKKEWRKILLESWERTHFPPEERHYSGDLESEVESIEYKSRMNVVKHEHDPRQQRLCRGFLIPHSRRPCVH